MQSRDLQERWCPHVKVTWTRPSARTSSTSASRSYGSPSGDRGGTGAGARSRCPAGAGLRAPAARPGARPAPRAARELAARAPPPVPVVQTHRCPVPLRRAHAVVRPGEYEIVRSRVPSEAFRVLEQPDVVRAVLRHQPHPAADPAEHRRSRVPSRGVRTSHAWAPGRVRPPPHRHPRRARVPAPSGHTVPARAGPRLHARREAARTGTGTPSRFTGDRRSAANGAARRAAAARGPGRAGGTPRVGTRSPLGGRQRIPGGRRAARQGEGNPLAGPMITGYGPRAHTGGSGRWGT